MAEVKPKVMEAVEKAIAENPEIANRELYEMATGMDAEIGELTLRQFNARYTLQVKRKRAAAEGRTRKPRRARKSPTRKTRRTGRAEVSDSSSESRDQIRTILLGFASDLAAADDRKDLVKVLANVDRYVNQIARVQVAG